MVLVLSITKSNNGKPLYINTVVTTGPQGLRSWLFVVAVDLGWDEQRYCKERRAGNNESDNGNGMFAASATNLAQQVTKAVQHPFFWPYANFIAMTAGCLEDQSSWCEGCECHGKTRISPSVHGSEPSKKRSYAQSRLLREKTIKQQAESAGFTADDDLDWLSREAMNCVFRGRRSPEFACGTFIKFCEDLVEFTRSEVMVIALGLTPELSSALMDDYQYAVDPWTVAIAVLI